MSNSGAKIHFEVVKFLLELPRGIKQTIVIFFDLTSCFLSVWLAFYLRLDVLVTVTKPVLLTLLTSVILCLSIFTLLGLYRAIFRYSGLSATLVVVRAMLIYALFFFVILTLYGLEGVPRSVGLIQPMVLLVLAGGARILARVFRQLVPTSLA